MELSAATSSFTHGKINQATTKKDKQTYHLLLYVYAIHTYMHTKNVNQTTWKKLE